MSDQLKRISIGDAIHFNSVSDPKFKHNRLSVVLILPLAAQSASDHAIVPLLLRKGFRECPDFTSLNARLCELYGASLDAEVSKWGGYQILQLSIRGLDNRFALEKEDLTKQCAELLASVVLDPNFNAEGVFHETDVALERQYLIDSIESEINEKRSYAISRCIQTMCADEPVAVRRLGTVDTAKQITPQSATAAYHYLLQNAAIEIFFTGSGESTGAQQIFTERFTGLKRTPIVITPYRSRPTAQSVREMTERMELSQSKLVLGMRTGAIDSIEEHNAARVFTALFGGTPFSKLFLNVREKLSLCYYCAAGFDASTQLLIVDSGVEGKNKPKAQKEILAQLAAVAKGDFDELELANTKLLMKNAIYSSTDSLSSVQAWYLSQILRGRDISPEQDAKNIDAVTREQVIQAASKVTLDTIYFLTGTEKEDAK